MRRPLLAVLALLLLGTAVVAAPADAKRKPTCQKQIKRSKAKVVARDHGVLVYQTNHTIGICDKRQRTLQDMAILNDGTKVTQVKAVKRRCALILASGKGVHPVLYFKDFTQDSVNTLELGYGTDAVARVPSMALASNCAAAWGDDTDGVFRVRATAVTPRSDLTTATTDVATVPSAADLAKVTIKAAGRKAVVGWTESGAAKSATLPAG